MAPFAGGCRSRIPPHGGAMLMLLRPPCLTGLRATNLLQHRTDLFPL